VSGLPGPSKVTRDPGEGLLKTRCEYIPVRSMAASLRPTVLSNPSPGSQVTGQTLFVRQSGVLAASACQGHRLQG